VSPKMCSKPSRQPKVSDEMVLRSNLIKLRILKFKV